MLVPALAWNGGSEAIAWAKASAGMVSGIANIGVRLRAGQSPSSEGSGRLKRWRAERMSSFWLPIRLRGWPLTRRKVAPGEGGGVTPARRYW